MTKKKLDQKVLKTKVQAQNLIILESTSKKPHKRVKKKLVKLKKEQIVPTKKRKKYKQCSVKTCKKKAEAGGKCRVHMASATKSVAAKPAPRPAVARRATIVSTPKPTVRSVTPLPKKTSKKNGGVNRVFYGMGVLFGKINHLVEK